MAIQTATLTGANQASLLKAFNDVSFLVSQAGNPDVLAAPITIVTNTVGSITLTVPATQSSPAFSRVISATVV
jgi:hypothetical protein